MGISRRFIEHSVFPIMSSLDFFKYLLDYNFFIYMGFEIKAGLARNIVEKSSFEKFTNFICQMFHRIIFVIGLIE